MDFPPIFSLLSQCLLHPKICPAMVSAVFLVKSKISFFIHILRRNVHLALRDILFCHYPDSYGLLFVYNLISGRTNVSTFYFFIFLWPVLYNFSIWNWKTIWLNRNNSVSEWISSVLYICDGDILIIDEFLKISTQVHLPKSGLIFFLC